MHSVQSQDHDRALWEAVTERCCGLDVHQKTVVACLLIGLLDQQPTESIRTFSTTTKGPPRAPRLVGGEQLHPGSH